ncbi:MAG: hypothetical protein AAB427_13430, partial [Chloroflexota bacterium]
MPLYWDEGFHIAHARGFVHGQYFYVFPYARWLNVVLIALLQPFGVESPWLARSVTVVLSLIAAVSCLWLGRRLGSRLAGRLALLLYGLLPFAFFYDRQTMADPIM